VTGFLGAVVFLTRLPVRTTRRLDTAHSVPWFPIVGLLIGSLVGGTAALLEPWASPHVAAGVAIVVGLLVTGSFHEDGLGDVADAFVGGWTRDDRLRILKDSRHGTYGVVALVSSIVLRFVALGALVTAGPKAAVIGAVAAHGLARSGAVGTMLAARPATGEGLGSDYVADMRRGASTLGIVVTVGVVATIGGWWAAVALGAVVVTTVVMVAWSRRKIGGFSGDVLGAIEQCAEIAVFVVLSMVAGHHQPWW
jgi:adenosylcobinamide-GDP ribazoletransferase